MRQRRHYYIMAAGILTFLTGCANLLNHSRTENGGTENSGDRYAATPALAVHSATPRAAAPRRMIGAGAEKVMPRQPIAKRVLALYYPWYQTPARSMKWAHQEGVDVRHKQILSHAHYPASGPYDSSDPALIDRHLAQAQAAGIDTLVCSWWGAGDPTDEAIRVLLKRAPKYHIKICVLWEQYAGAGGADELRRNLTYLLQGMARSSAFLKADNRPVIFVYERVRQSANYDTWIEVLNEITTRYPPGVFIVGDGRTADERLMWDGQYSLHAPDRMVGQTPEANAKTQHRERLADVTESRRQNHVAVVSLMPGYDDRRYNALHRQPGSILVNREDGQLYAALWKQAIADKPDWILINSFNQWHAGNEIEPSLEMGDRYLKMTRAFADKFKQ